MKFPGRKNKLKVLITAGPTREYLDPVRFISNASSGKTAYQLAQSALKNTAEVTLISGPVNIQPPAKARLIPVHTTKEMLTAALRSAPNSDIIIFCAAVCDFRPAQFKKQKIKKEKTTGLTLKLIPAENILKTVSHLLSIKNLRTNKTLIGFALETNNLIKNAKTKLKNGSLDMIVANPGNSIGSDTSGGFFIYADGKIKKIKTCSKQMFAQQIWKEAKKLHEQKKPA